MKIRATFYLLYIALCVTSCCDLDNPSGIDDNPCRSDLDWNGTECVCSGIERSEIECVRASAYLYRTIDVTGFQCPEILAIRIDSAANSRFGGMNFHMLLESGQNLFYSFDEDLRVDDMCFSQDNSLEYPIITRCNPDTDATPPFSANLEFCREDKKVSLDIHYFANNGTVDLGITTSFTFESVL